LSELKNMVGGQLKVYIELMQDEATKTLAVLILVVLIHVWQPQAEYKAFGAADGCKSVEPCKLEQLIGTRAI
jgi:hypothetical protein